jgi:hypothetical protein
VYFTRLKLHKENTNTETGNSEPSGVHSSLPVVNTIRDSTFICHVHTEQGTPAVPEVQLQCHILLELK